MYKSWVDWVVIVFVIASLFFLVSFVQQKTVQGQVVGFSFSQKECASFSSPQPVSLSSSLRLCANTTHFVEYFNVNKNNVVIDCQGSTLKGSGGALFVARMPNPMVTLQNCTLAGYGGLYSNTNRVDVRIE